MTDAHVRAPERRSAPRLPRVPHPHGMQERPSVVKANRRATVSVS